MTVLDRSELQASPLSDLHLIAGQVGVEGFRRLRKAELIDAILAHQGVDGEQATSERSRASVRQGRSRGARSSRSSRARVPTEPDSELEEEGEAHESASRDGARAERRVQRAVERTVEGTVEVLGNGSALLRVHPPESSDDDVYISAAQVRRCELVSGDAVSGPIRTPRRSERYPSLIRVETINGRSADAVVEGPRYEDMPSSWPSERISFDVEDPTLQAIEWLTPLGLGSRVSIVGGPRAGKSETLRRMLAALAGREGLELVLVLAGVRPEEIDQWREGTVPVTSALSFAASADAQGRAVESAIESAKRLVGRGADVIVAIDGLDGLHPHTARRVLAAARNLREGGSLTVLATASRPFGGETTVIALDAVTAGAGRFPALDLPSSGTHRAELLVGDEGAEAIAKARAAAAAEG